MSRLLLMMVSRFFRRFEHLKRARNLAAAAAMANGTAWEHTATRRARRVRMPPAPKIFFASRTHSQLAQCVKELKRCKGFQEWTLEADLAPTAAAWQHRHDLQATANTESTKTTSSMETKAGGAAVTSSSTPSAEKAAAPESGSSSTETVSLEAFAYDAGAEQGTSKVKPPTLPPLHGDKAAPAPAAASTAAAPPPSCAPAPQQLPPVPEPRKYSTHGKLRMTVLGSREQYCVHSTVSKSSSKNDDCRAQVRAGTCAHYPIANNLKNDLPVVWDIEEAVARSKAKKQRGGCPYYASKSALEWADIVLCPYSYLVDPAVRDSMSLDVKGAVVILDEAHNIEDVAREAASLSLSYLDLEDVLHSLQLLGAKDGYTAMAPAVIRPLEAMSTWLRKQAKEMGLGETAPVSARDMAAASSRGQVVRSARVVKGAKGGNAPKFPDRVLSNPASLTIAAQEWGLSAAAMDSWTHAADELLAQLKQDTATDAPTGGAADSSSGGGGGAARSSSTGADADLLALQGKVKAALEMLTHTMGFWLRGGQGAYKGDFRVAVTAEQAVDAHGAVCVQSILHVWCLRASCTMADLAAEAHSIVLTSGTLSPLASFASELGVPFPVRLEAAHVIQLGQQLFSAVLPHAVQRCKPPGTDGGAASEWNTGSALKGVYSVTQTTTYKDGLGASLCSIAETIPGGMLVFFSSYSLLDACVSRWTETGSLQQLQSLKPVHAEPRGRDGKEEFENMLLSYRAAVQKWTPHEFTGAFSKGLPRGTTGHDINTILMAKSDAEPEPPKKARGGRHQQQSSLKRDWGKSRGARGGGRGGGRFGPGRRSVQPGDGGPRSNGACMLAVCRGKVSEGIDFSDEFARCVVLVGLPYPAFKDPQVMAKRQYQTAMAQNERRNVILGGSASACSSGTALSGDDWYAQQAFRALNQALGRCIRHRNDYGAVILADPRYNEQRTLDGVSRWLRAGVQTGLKGGELMERLSQFVRQVPQRVVQRVQAQTAAAATAAVSAKAPIQEAATTSARDRATPVAKPVDPPASACTAGPTGDAIRATAADASSVQRSMASESMSAVVPAVGHDVSLNSSTSSGNKQYLGASQLPFTLTNVQAAAVAHGFGGVKSGTRTSQVPLVLADSTNLSVSMSTPRGDVPTPMSAASAAGVSGKQRASLQQAAIEQGLDDSVNFANLGLDLSQDSTATNVSAAAATEDGLHASVPAAGGGCSFTSTPPTQLAASSRRRPSSGEFAEPLQSMQMLGRGDKSDAASLHKPTGVATHSVYSLPTQPAPPELSAALDMSQGSSMSSGDEAAFQAVARVEREHALKLAGGDGRGTKRPADATTAPLQAPSQRRRDLLGAMWAADAEARPWLK